MTNESAQIKHLKRRMKKYSLAWDVIYYKKIGDHLTVAVVGTDFEISAWARSQKNEYKFSKWISIPYPEFNHRYEGFFRLVAIPSWGLLRKPNQ